MMNQRDEVNGNKRLREHVVGCSQCVVDQGGGVWYCREGAQIAQEVRKARFFGGCGRRFSLSVRDDRRLSASTHPASPRWMHGTVDRP